MWERFVQSGYFAEKAGKASSHAEVRTFWCKKASDFSKFMVCPYGQEGGGEVELVCRFCQQKRSVNFSRFCEDVFY